MPPPRYPGRFMLGAVHDQLDPTRYGLEGLLIPFTEELWRGRAHLQDATTPTIDLKREVDHAAYPEAFDDAAQLLRVLIGMSSHIRSAYLEDPGRSAAIGQGQDVQAERLLTF